MQLGAQEWEALFPRAILPGTVPDAAPFAGVLYAMVEADHDKVTTESTNVFFNVVSAGNLGRRVSWYAAAGAGTKGAAIERVWLSLDKLAGTWLGVRAGYLEPAIVPFSRYTHKLSYEGYLPFESGGPAGLALSASRPALEAFGAGADPGPLRGLQYTVGLASRDAVGGLAADGYARLSYKFGGVAAAGDQSGEPGRLAPVVTPLEEQSLRVGGFLWRATLRGPDTRPRATRAGLDAQLLLGQLDAFASAWTGTDAASAAAADTSSWSFLSGAGFRPWPWLYFLGRYEAAWAGRVATRRVVGTARVAVQQNVAFSAELVVELPDAESTEMVGSLFLAF